MKRQKTGYELKWDENEPGFEFNPGFEIRDAIVVWFSSAGLLIASSIVFMVVTFAILLTTCGLHCNKEFPLTESIFEVMGTVVENHSIMLITLTVLCVVAVYLLKFEYLKAVGFTSLMIVATAIGLHVFMTI